MSENHLSSDPVIYRFGKRGPEKETKVVLKKQKNVQHFFNKLNHPKSAGRLCTCEFDEQLLQFPGLLGSLTPKLETGWQSAAIGTNGHSGSELENQIVSELPPLIRPISAAQYGPTGPVPLSYSFTWTRYKPEIVTSDEPGGDPDIAVPRIIFKPISEPEVVLLLTSEQIKGLTKITGDGKSSIQTSALTSFGTRLSQLSRPVSCILFTGAKLRNLDKKRVSVASTCSRLSLNQLCVQLQLKWNVRATRVCSSVQDVATIVASYNRSIAQRPFKDGRLFRDEGLNFLPDTVRMGLAGCASHGRGAGPAPNATAGTNSAALHAWANRVWLAQLGQWRGLTGEIAHSIALTYPTARAFFRACQQSEKADQVSSGSGQFTSTNRKRKHPLEASLADLEVRRGAGVLSSRRRLGPEFARRLVTHFTVDDPTYVIE